MVDITLENLVKTFGPIVAVDNVTLQIKHGEFFTLLGPSGCGKTTTLRMIAGFYTPEKGSIKFNEKRMNEIPAEKRNTGMVFQNYAIWPHMTVAKNVAFGLEMRKIPPEEIVQRVKGALDLVELEGLEERTPDQLSGGQQQRVALARALVIEPDVLLLDEPLSNLDAKLRVEMRKEIKSLQRKMGITTIYVTHDQKEALAVSDRLAVMNRGKIEQVGNPLEIYGNPKNRFVANFIGLINLFQGTVEHSRKSSMTIKTVEGLELCVNPIHDVKKGTQVLLAVRPEKIEIHPHGFTTSAGTILEGTIEGIEYVGDLSRYNIKTQYQNINADQYSPSIDTFFNLGDNVTLQINRDDINFIETLN
ncbi:MAG: ABC transporter ATP-binding protein [Candidatus Bathyarchaeota archaeon]|nr:ABC transporter ATP-binding protein [Candidatus Bathyarchaeota archaeon]